ncbi:hypothetical protein NQ176_g8341 [Zarea fungicola]|uniref:Uncharacterized protein n=1 Tax=Zarea fungicola TaxID=93591 RepID=A0ACC1MT02_9HYPO|nr:hypothetical protein NQ176_g8341 [Lecanicillium fungicola]
MDETGFQIGTAKGNYVVTLRRKNASLLGIPTNTEYATYVESISAAGEHIPGFIILTGKVYQSKWFTTPNLPDNYVIGLSESGYTNDQLSLAWLKHFEKHTKAKASGDTRLLIIDGCGSHHTREFVDYAFEHNIVPFGLPPQLAHLLQPLDVVIFSPMKYWHSTAVSNMVRNGIDSIKKEDILAVIDEIRGEALKTNSIIKAFKKQEYTL